MKDTYLEDIQELVFEAKTPSTKDFDDEAMQKIADHAAEASISWIRSGLSKLRLDSETETHYFDKVKSLVISAIRKA